MKLFVQSASLDEIRPLAEAGLVDGITLSYADLEPGDVTLSMRERIEELDRAFSVPICVPVAAVAENDIYREGRELGRVSEHVIVRVPFVEDAILPIRKLVADGIPVCATYVYTGAQAFLAAKIGANMVMISADDLEANAYRSAGVVAEVRDVLDQTDVECDLMVSTSENAHHFTDCVLAGADTVCVPPTTLRGLLVHSLTDRGIDRFLSNLSKRHKSRGAS